MVERRPPKGGAVGRDGRPTPRTGEARVRPGCQDWVTWHHRHRREEDAMSVMEGLGFLTAVEADLVRETEPDRMAELDEDELLNLHGRVRRGRTKYSKLYRQQAQRRGQDKGARGAGQPGKGGKPGKGEGVA